MELANVFFSPLMPVVASPDTIRSLILEKEQELNDINEYRIRALEIRLRDKETAMNAVKQTLCKLQNDFKDNLKLLKQREKELTLNNTKFDVLKGVVKNKEDDLSVIRAREKELRSELQRVQEKRDEVEIQCQQKLKDAQNQVEDAKCKFNDKFTGEQEAVKILRRNFETQLIEKESEAERQRREVRMTFDNVIKQRETDFEREREELQTKVRDVELQNKTLLQNVDAQHATVEELTTTNEHMQQMIEENEKKTKSLEWLAAIMQAVEEVKVKGLKSSSDVVELIKVKQQCLDDHERMMANVLQILDLVQKTFVQQNKQHDEELSCFIERKRNGTQETSTGSKAQLLALAERLREKVEILQAELKHAKWDADDKMMDTEREIKRLRSALQDLRDEQQQLRAGDRKFQTLYKRLKESATHIALLKKKNKAQYHQLLESVKKQKELQHELVAVNVQWDNRWQEKQQELKKRHDLRLHELLQEKDCLLNEKQAVEERLVRADDEVQRLRSELASVKACTVLMDPSGYHYVASAARVSLASVTAALSPLWSNDPKTVALVSYVPPLEAEILLVRPKTTSAGTSINTFETKNAMLRELIGQMKELLIQQAQEMEALLRRAGGTQSAYKPVEQLLERQEHCVALDREQDKNSRTDSDISLSFESCERELTAAKQSIEMKTGQIVELESRIQELEEVRAAKLRLQSKYAAVKAQRMDLHRKLEAAHCDIARLVRERSQIMELSNQLRADLRRSGHAGNTRPSTSRVQCACKTKITKT